MLKILCVAALAAVCHSAEYELSEQALAVPMKISSSSTGLVATLDEDAKAPGQFCNACVQAALSMINVILNDILNGVVLKSCGQLCGKLAKGAPQNICNIACDIFGIKELVKLLNSTDPD